MPRLAGILALILILAGGPALAGSPPAVTQDEMIGFATNYTKMVTLGIVGGGLIMNIVVGGATATLAGAVVGSTLASWLFIGQEAHNYVIQRARPGGDR